MTNSLRGKIPARSGRPARRVHRRPIATLACVVLALGACSGPPRRHGHPDERPAAQKSVLVGALLAIFPGLLWHGLGHRYAGDVKKAEEIELMQAYSVLGMAAGTGLYFAGRSNDYLKGMEVTGYTVGGLGALGFVGTWLYDIIYTPSAIRRYNAGLEYGEYDDPY